MFCNLFALRLLKVTYLKSLLHMHFFSFLIYVRSVPLTFIWRRWKGWLADIALMLRYFFFKWIVERSERGLIAAANFYSYVFFNDFYKKNILFSVLLLFEGNCMEFFHDFSDTIRRYLNASKSQILLPTENRKGCKYCLLMLT